MRIALTGNPNSGKTTMYNALTGRNEKVGNWAGVTVDKKEAPIKKQFCAEQTLLAVDLPGAYSMSPFTAEESVTRNYIWSTRPDVIINIVDATNLSRSLFFTTQLLELGIPVVVALNKTDLNQKKKTLIDTAALAKKLGCPVVSLLGWQAGFQTNSTYGAARIKRVNPERIRAELDKKRIVIVAGFQGLNRYDDITTLGRGGSDTSAVAIAAAMRADLCQIYTDVDGVYDRDPRQFPEAVRYEQISYDHMLSLIEKAEKSFDAEKAAKMEERLKSNKFTLQDYLDQLGQVKNMGDLSQMASMIPGVNAKALEGAQMDDKAIAHIEAIITSMTPYERENPEVLNSSRKKRIAAGCGLQVVDVNRLLKQYEAMQQMMKMVSGKGMKKMRKKMGGMGGFPGIPGL